jgi:kynurenine formamidase
MVQLEEDSANVSMSVRRNQDDPWQFRLEKSHVDPLYLGAHLSDLLQEGKAPLHCRGRTCYRFFAAVIMEVPLETRRRILVRASTRLFVACGILLWGCTPLRSQTVPETVIDLTYGFDDQTIYWPTNKSFRWERKDWGTAAGGYWYASADFSASEHGGTHIDAPIHFGAGRQTVDQIPLERLIGPAVVIDVRAQCLDPDYELRIEDLLAWEAKHSRMPEGAIVLMWTGWGQHWPDRKRYLGSETPDVPTSLHFPGFSSAAAEFLIMQRAIRGVGIDTASIDPGRSRDFAAHRVLNGADVYALENVAALSRLPPRGATIVALPVKITGGTGGPVRIIAFLP